MNVLYITSKRGEEFPVLVHLESEGRLSFDYVKINMRSAPACLKGLFAVLKTVRRSRPDVILMEHAAIPTLIGLLVKLVMGMPLAVHIKGDCWVSYGERALEVPLRQKVAKRAQHAAALLIFRYADMLFPISADMRTVVRRNLRAPKPMRVVHIPLSGKKGDMEAPSGLSGIPHGGLILTVTNFNFWEKVVPLGRALVALAPVLAKYSLSWAIVGDGFFAEKFRKEFVSGENVGVIGLLGRRDPFPFYRSALAFFHISGMDGLPNVIMEAASERLPVVMNDDCPAREFIVDGHNGLLVNVEDTAHVDVVLGRLVADEGYRDQLGENARLYVLRNFSVEKVSLELASALRSCIAISRAHRTGVPA
ncbi:MAG: glycosyltransferase [Candidatus Krumholzibacteriota bacterium]|nr:glycosyltransferase [Candidatus Krumholzibacteriota bacterium]